MTKAEFVKSNSAYFYAQNYNKKGTENSALILSLIFIWDNDF